MTLRLRLVLSLLSLVAAALVIFGLVTYSLFNHDAHQQLDAQLHNSLGLVKAELNGGGNFLRGGGVAGGLAPLPATNDGDQGSPDGGNPQADRPGGYFGRPPEDLPPGTFGEKLSAAGKVIDHLPYSTNSARPKLPKTLPKGSSGGTLFTVGSTSGSGSYRVLVASDPNGFTYVVASPDTTVTRSTHSLFVLETAGAAALLLVVSLGAWLVLRRGLRPLEQMAGTARSITAGDLSQRVTESGPSEVGELGRAFNSMLVDIEAAFQEREATEHKLRQFLADASHELRTPLTSIQGFAELFRVSGDNARVDLPTILRRIEGESARMRVLVDDLLLLARLDQTRAAERAPVDLAVLAADACSDAAAVAPDRPVTLDAPEPVVIAGDQAHLRQAIGNLVANSLRHTPGGTPIEVSARLDDGSALVAVRDHGAGLDDVALEHVFDRFWQADKGRVGTGAGLGLAIVASIAAEHGGVASGGNAPGGGAVFTLRLPVNSVDQKVETATTRL